jgi:HK97 family phage portal protein
MALINLIKKAKKKKPSDQDSKFSKQIADGIIQEQLLNKEFLDKNDTVSLIKAFKHVVYIAIDKNSSVISTTNYKLYSKKQTNQKIFKSKNVGFEEKKYISKNYYNLVRDADNIFEITDHPFLTLMNKPNQFTSYFELLYKINTYLDLTGNSFLYIEKNKLGMPIGLYCLPTELVKIKPSKNLYVEDYYLYNDNKIIKLGVDNVIHIKRFDPANIFFGKSPLAACEASFNMREFMDNYEVQMFANEGRPSGIVTTDQVVVGTNGWEKIKGVLQNEIGGLGNVGKIAVLDNGFKYEQISLTPRDLEAIEGRRMTASEIRNAYGQTDALYDSSANRSTSDTADYMFRKDAILPRLILIQNKLNNVLVPMFDENLFMLFDNPVPIDQDKQAKRLCSFVSGGIYTPNEARMEVGKERKEGTHADELLIPVNLATMSQVYNDEDEDEKKNKSENKEED